MDPAGRHKHGRGLLSDRRSVFLTKMLKSLTRLARYVFMSLVLAVMVIPVVWVFSSAFRPVPEIFKFIYPLSWKTFIPQQFTVENFTALLFGKDSPWPRYIFNTLFVAGSVLVVGTLINALAAYGFARLRFPGRDNIFTLILLTMIIPFESIALPLFLVVKQFGWLDSFSALIVPALANAFSIFLLRQFFQGIDRELEEAASLDGATPLRVFLQIIVPLSWPALVSSGLITFQASWDSFIWPVITTSSPKARVIQIGISNLAGQDATYWNELFAAVALAALVPMVLFLIFQRYYTEGVGGMANKS